MKKLIYILFTTLLSTNILANTKIEESIVKIYTVAKTPNCITPWNTNIKRSHGSGSIINGNGKRILIPIPINNRKFKRAYCIIV